MIVTPAPVGLLIVVLELGKIAVFAMVLFRIHAICLIFVIVPLMIVVVLIVVVCDSFPVLGSQRVWHQCYRDRKGGGK